MSETTNKMRDVAIYSDSLIRVRDLTADAIEAVEAQVAEAAKRHEDLAAWCAETEARVAALEKRQGKDGAQVASSGCASVPVAVAPESTASPAAPVRRFLPGDRVRVAKDTRWGSGYLSKLGTIESLTDPTGAWDYVVRMDEMGYAGPHPLANDADLEPAPSAPPAPRGFRVGDRVRITNAHRCSSDWIGCEGRIVAGREDSLGDWTIGDLTKFAHLKTVPMHSQALTLVRAADAPGAPAEDAGLVERLARDWDKAESIWLDWAIMSADGRTTRCNVARHILATLRAEGRLCAPGEVARLTEERDDWKYAAEVQKKDTEGWKARAEAAEKALDVERDSDYRVYLVTNEDGDSEGHWIAKTRWDALADFKRDTGTTEGEFSTVCLEGPGTKDWCRGWADGRPGEDEVHAITKKVRTERDALRAELDALKAKPRFRTRSMTAADVRALDNEWAKSKYVGRDSWVLAMRALGFRRRVDGAK